ncbi:sensor domain-containing diguanylate cyclase [uncultured Pseudomonas sp.]|uniref:sensor domain-containing diguanylate cyclase n=1 Tax=uncultured Pseudomonas sp. TaxID=114707 RepID=UPI0025E89EBA|nr:sensor domain-containing diguanylate cyclase [uncultured Pseudomonas sp.]
MVEMRKEKQQALGGFLRTGKWLRSWLTLLSFAGSVFLGWMLLQRFEDDARRGEQVRTREVATTFAVSVEKVVERALTATRTLAVMVYQGHGEVPDFPALARFVLPLYKGVYALSLAPNGFIRQIEPLDRNLLVRDHDLLEFQNRDEVLRAYKANDTRIQFMGPFKLIQGPIGAIGMLPVFLPGPQGKPRFWGYTVVTLVLPEALEDANLSAMAAQGYAYQLVGIDPETNERRILLRSGPAVVDGTCREVKIEAMTWTLCVSPQASWQSQARHYFEFGLVLVGSASLAWLVYGLMGRRERRAELLRQALLDPLTGLANRRLLMDRLAQAQERTRRDGKRLAVALLDLDGFKGVNDNFGHAQGDRVLIVTAERLLGQLRSSDTLARLGGDEFVLIMENLAGHEEGRQVLERLLQVVREPLQLEGGIGQVYASIGVVIWDPTKAGDSEAILRQADAAMYQAKRLGKNRYVLAGDVFTAQQH